MAAPAEQIARALGEGVATAKADTLAAFDLAGRTPQAVGFPASPQQAAEMLALANGEGWGVVPWGGGHGAACGNPPARYDLALSTARLGAVVEHDQDNLTLTAQAGATLGEVNRQLLAVRQMLPLGSAGDRGTLGGIIAANRPVPRRLAHGDVRDLLLGVTVALPDGTLARYGRKVIKNVAGYDMNKLFLGSQGMFGVVVEAIFRLAALPDEEGFLLGTFPGPSEAAGAAGALLASPLRPSCLFLLDSKAAAALAGRWGSAPAGTGVRTGTGVPTGTAVLVGFAGRAVTLRRQLADGRALMEPHKMLGCSTPPPVTPAGDGYLTAPWAPVDRPPPQPAGRATEYQGVGLTIGVPVSQVAATMEETAAALGRLKLEAALLADFPAGAIRVAIAPAAVEALAPLAQWIATLREALLPQRGFAVLQAAPPQLAERVDVWGGLGGEGDIMAMLKARFDPQGILAPGRFLPQR